MEKSNRIDIKICIISVYFGKLPRYFPLWLKSAAYNSSIDFIVYTDDKNNYNLPQNVRIQYLTLNQLKKMADTEFCLDTALDRPYKCCDFKPVYGIIFRNNLKSYDYWGHCDLDLIFGDIESFLTNYKIQEYDHFLTLGHLSFYKNTDSVNNYYRLSGGSLDYKTVFCTSKSFAFDETYGITEIYRRNALPFFSKRLFADISPIYNRYKLSRRYKLDDPPRNYKRQTFVWENGKTYRVYYLNKKIHREEYMYVHFQKRNNYLLNEDINNARSFYITNTGFYECNEQISKMNICKMNPFHGYIYEFFEYLHFSIPIEVKKNKGRIKRLFSFKTR